MSRALPQGLRTAKTNSLPDDLKKIAEELIADKFGIEEEVLVNPQDTFLDPRRGTNESVRRCGNSFCASCYGGIDPCGFGDPRRVDFDPRFRGHFSFGMRTTVFTLESCYNMLKDFDRQNIRRERREFRMGRFEFRELMQDARFDSVSTYRTEGAYPSIFGTRVRIVGDRYGHIELAETY